MPSVRYEKSGAVGHIVLCNPPLNLLNVEFYEQLRDAELSATSDDLRAVLVRAEGPNFCGGGDAPALNSLDTGGFRLLMAEFNRSFRALEALSVPTVAAVRGREALDLAQELANGPTRSYEAVLQILKAWSAGGVAGADAVMLDVAFALHEATAAARELADEKSA